MKMMQGASKAAQSLNREKGGVQNKRLDFTYNHVDFTVVTSGETEQRFTDRVSWLNLLMVQSNWV